MAVRFKTAHPPTGQTPGHLTFCKISVKFPGMLAVELDGQMLHWLVVQKRQIPHPPGIETSIQKFPHASNRLFKCTTYRQPKYLEFQKTCSFQ